MSSHTTVAHPQLNLTKSHLYMDQSIDDIILHMGVSTFLANQMLSRTSTYQLPRYFLTSKSEYNLVVNDCDLN